MVQKVNFNNLTGDTLTVGNTVITGTGVTVSGSPLSGGSGGATQYANTSQLPKQDLTFGEFALIGNTLFITNGVGWYSVALINQSPSLSISVSDISLGSDGNTIDFTYTATDPDGPEPTVSVELIGANSAQANVTLYTANSTVTVENLSATDYSANIVLTATDGIDQTFGTVTLNVAFFSEVWTETVLSIGTSSTDGLDNSTFIDRSTNAHTASTSGTPIQTAFHPYLDKWSVEFDGNGDYLTIADNSAFNMGSGDFTAEAWIYRTGTGTTQYNDAVIYSTASPSDQQGFGVLDRGGNFAIVLSNGGGSWTVNTNTNVAIGNNEWVHVAFVRNGNAFYLYKNGTQVWTGGGSYTLTNTNNLYSIGGRSNLTQFFLGYIADHRLVKGTAVYTSNFTPPTEPLTSISGTSLLTCQSNRFIDNSTNAHTITTVGNVKISAFNPFGQGSEYAVGENKGSFRLETGDWVQVPSTSSASLSYTQDWTIEFWAYMDNDLTSVAQMLFNSVEGTGNWYPYIGSNIRAGGQLQTQAVGGEHLTTGYVNPYEWFHVALVHDYSANELKTYLNGTLVQTLSKTFTLTTGAIRFNSYTINTASNYPTLGGHISDFRWTIGSTVYTSDFTPPTAPVGNTNAGIYVPFDNSGIFDKTSNHTLTLLGDTSTSTTQTKFADTAMYFDGNDYIIGEMSDNLFFNEQSMTIECWIYPTALGGVGHSIFDTRSGFDSASLLIWIVGTELQVYIGDYSGASPIISGGTISVNQWSHIAFTRESGTNTNRLFINGTSTAINTIAWNQTSASGREYRLGQVNGYDRPFYGYMENFQILKGVAKYTANFTPPNRTQGRSYQAQS